MAIGHVIESLGLDGPVSYLDACAAPGGKTTAAIDALPSGSTIVANEAEPSRAAALAENLMRWGAPNVWVTLGPAQKLGRLPEAAFDLITADVPCSGEGMMRKEPKAVEQWSQRLVEDCAALQRDIVASIWPLLKPGGHLIYSTCTFAPEEDEDNVRWICNELGAELLPLPEMPGVVDGHFYPHLVRGEGLYMALLRKPGEGRARLDLKKLQKVAKVFRSPTDGLYEQKGREQIASHGMALRADCPRGQWPEVEVSKQDALKFLHRDALTLPTGTPRGQVLLTYGAHPLGFVNNLGPRANNLLPKSLRILSAID